jgi:hypothetical protein
MTLRKIVLPGFGLSAILCASAAASDDPPPSPQRPPVRVYTNEDLDRVRPFRNETGVASVPAVAPDGPASRSRAGALDGRGSALVDAHGRGEDYWRREAERVRDRMRAMATQADELRLRLAERSEEASHALTRGRRGSSGSGATSAASLRARIAALESRMKEMETDLSERARRARALPGWLR